MGRLGIAVLLGLIVTQPLFAEDGLEEGKWEFEIWYTFIGVPQHFPSYTKTQCISKEDPIPQISRPGHECSRKLQGEFSSTYTWLVNCSTDWEAVQGIGRVEYAGGLARGDVHVQVINPVNPPQPMVFYVRGERVGSCD